MGEKFIGNLTCAKLTGTCDIVSLKQTSDFRFGADYAPTDALETINLGQPVRRRKLADDSSLLKDPIICLYAGDAIVFTVTPTHFPKYCKESLLNSIASFDEGPLLELEAKLNSGQDIINFAYTFY